MNKDVNFIKNKVAKSFLKRHDLWEQKKQISEENSIQSLKRFFTRIA